jgi:hypothetical protein
MTRVVPVVALAMSVGGGAPATMGCASHAASSAHPDAPRVHPGVLDAVTVLGDLPKKASALGASPMTLISGGEMNEGERAGAFVDVPKDMCLLAYARGSSSVEDLDVAAFADEGNPLAIDESSDPKPTVMLCPPHPTRVYLTVHDASGEGLVALASHLVPPDRSAAVAREVGAKGASTGPTAADAWPGLADRVREHHGALGGHWEELRRVAIPVDARMPSLIAFPAEEGSCTDVLLVPDDEIALVEAEVQDGAGRVVARAREGGTDRTLTVCSPIGFAGQLSIRPHVGRGLVAVVLAKSKDDAAVEREGSVDVAWMHVTEPLAAARLRRDAALTQNGYGAPSVRSNGELLVGRRARLPFETRSFAGGCYRADIVGGAPLALVEAELHDDAGAVVARARGASGATLFGCSGGKLTLDVEAQGRPGPYALLARRERWQDPAFAQHPLAASRMLTALATGTGASLGASAGPVRTFVVDADHVISFEATVAPNTCLRIAAGAEGKGTGLELRLLDTAGEGELDRSHARDAVVARACAQNAPRPIHAELRGSNGSLDAVVGVRVF